MAILPGISWGSGDTEGTVTADTEVGLATLRVAGNRKARQPWLAARSSSIAAIPSWRKFPLETLSLRLLKIKPEFPEFGCLRRVGSGLQVGFFHKVAPTGAPVFLTLTPFEIVEGSFRALGPFNNCHNPTRDVGLLVEPNDGEGTIRLVCHFF